MVVPLNHPFLIGFSIINHPISGVFPLFLDFHPNGMKRQLQGHMGGHLPWHVQRPAKNFTALRIEAQLALGIAEPLGGGMAGVQVCQGWDG